MCSVQFSPESPNLLVFGSADFKIACYDIRKTKAALCQLSGHGRAVSYVAFCGGNRLVSASTDNTLKLWDLSRAVSAATSYAAVPAGPSSSYCLATFSGHTNEKVCFSCCLLHSHWRMLLLRFMSCAPSSTHHLMSSLSSSCMEARNEHPPLCCLRLLQNFVGLSVADDGYIACGSENNSVRVLALCTSAACPMLLAWLLMVAHPASR